MGSLENGDGWHSPAGTQNSLPVNVREPVLPLKSPGFEDPLREDNDYTRSSTPDHPCGLGQKQTPTGCALQARGPQEPWPRDCSSPWPCHPAPARDHAKHEAAATKPTASRFQYQTMVNEDRFEADVVLRGTVSNEGRLHASFRCAVLPSWRNVRCCVLHRVDCCPTRQCSPAALCACRPRRYFEPSSQEARNEFASHCR